MNLDPRTAPQLELDLLPPGVPHTIDVNTYPGGLVNHIYAMDGTLLTMSLMRDEQGAEGTSREDIDKTFANPRSRQGVWVVTYDGDTGFIFAALRVRRP